MLRLPVSVALFEGAVFHALDGFHCDQVGVGSLPASWDGCAMTVDEYAVIGGIFEDFQIQFHRGLFVTAKEVDLNTLDAHFLKFGEFLSANDSFMHFVFGTHWSVVPWAV